MHPNGGPGPEIQCSGSTIWAVFYNGAGMSQEAYVGVRSADGGHTWRLVFSEPFFGVKAPHELDAYLGVWVLRGRRDAYFTGNCPACDGGKHQDTVSLWVTKDGGRTFRMYKVPELTGYTPRHLRIARNDVTVSATAFELGLAPHKTVTVHIA